MVALLDPAGEATDTYLYDPFDNVAHTGTSSNPIQFSSEIFDQETGLVYYNYRNYNPKTGRWTKRDPMGEQGGVNLYAFLANGPIHRVDELGLKKVERRFKPVYDDNQSITYNLQGFLCWVVPIGGGKELS